MRKRILAVHDISAVGKCSLTVALPVLSAAGIETAVLPTAVLSTHTGEFTGYTFRDLTDDLRPMMEHWQSLGLTFDAIYTGYLGSSRQLALVEELFDRFGGENTLLAVDPVMADGGQMYSCFAPDFPAGMAHLCRRADLIVPNLTEAALLLGRPYDADPGEDGVEELLRALAKLGPGKVVLTGVGNAAGKTGAAALDARTGEICRAFSPRLPGVFYGTGDVFASALLGGVLGDIPLSQALPIAVNTVYASARATCRAGTPRRFGVDFEGQLPQYIRALSRAHSTQLGRNAWIKK
ncbi:MAG: pyridoxamine kinase [Eubacteriales bacterium]|nr:pyridoxamine kinase [Eubacteriales bacterium]